MAEIRFADTTVRDGPLSLWANNIRTGMIAAVARDLDSAGFVSIETQYAHPKKVVREQREDPWERLRVLRRHVTETPLRAITARFRAFDYSPPSAFELLVQCNARVGIREARISDEWNQRDKWEAKVNLCRDVGIKPIVNLIYSYSPKHTDEYYAERTRQLASLDPFRICLKDPGGLLTPERMKTLVPIVLANAGDHEIELHSHCTTGLGPVNAIEAVKLGINIINTGVPPLANGTALPSVFNVAQNVRAMGHEPLYHEAAARRVERKLSAIARLEGLPPGRPVEPDVTQYRHQIPGGMLTNLRHQLKLVGLEHKYNAAVEECALVREEWGWPIMVTPLSQFVGSQAAINVIVGERYKAVTDQTILYALGYWGGAEAIQAMQPDVRDRILNRARARELARWEPPTPSVAELRKQYGGPGIDDFELLLRMEVLDQEIAVMRSAGPPKSYEHLDAELPLATLVEELARRADRDFIRVQKETFSLTLAKAATA